MVAFLIALPYVLYQVWAFVAPGLYAHEKKLALPLVASSVLLFFVGMSFAYFLVFPTVFGFMANVAPEGVAWMTDIEKYLSFVMTTFVAFGVAFEVPVIVVVLVFEQSIAAEAQTIGKGIGEAVESAKEGLPELPKQMESVVADPGTSSQEIRPVASIDDSSNPAKTGA